MRLIDRIARRLGYVKPQKRTGFDAADHNRLTASLRAESEYINTTLRYQLATLRARSRQAAQNNPYAKRFVQLFTDNVAGSQGFRLRAKTKSKSGELDTAANRKIEEVWEQSGKRGQWETTGRWSRCAMERLITRTLAIDGEVLIRILKGRNQGRYGFRIQVIDVNRLDEQKNARLDDGGAIHMGVQVDANGKPTAYHILKRTPSQWQYGTAAREYDIVPADEIIHLFIPEFAEQVRGIPPMYVALINLMNLGGFEEAAVIAARVGASQMGFIQTPDGGDNMVSDGKDANGNPQYDAEPGAFPFLPPGYEMSNWNPKYPDAAIEPFIKAMLKGLSAGLGPSYHNIASDLEGVNYSSARVGELTDREMWMCIQNFVIEHLSDPIYNDHWLPMQLATKTLPFDVTRIDKYRSISWQPRRWSWVDPDKEVKAAINAKNSRIRSLTRIIADQGEDIEDVFDEVAQEEKMAEEKGITIGGQNNAETEQEDEQPES